MTSWWQSGPDSQSFRTSGWASTSQRASDRRLSRLVPQYDPLAALGIYRDWWGASGGGGGSCSTSWWWWPRWRRGWRSRWPIFRGAWWLLLPAVLLYTLPLLLRGRWPFAMPALVIAVQVVVSFLDGPGGCRENLGVVAYVLATWAFSAYNPLRAAVGGLGVALAGIVVVTLEDLRVPADEAFSVALVGSLTWGAGAVLRRRSLSVEDAEERAAALERARRDAVAAVAEERARTRGRRRDPPEGCLLLRSGPRALLIVGVR
jgi:hypothetical protein